MPQTIELRPAYEWTCPECGRDNFERAVVAEMSAEEDAELRAEHGVESERAGEWLLGPVEVECPHCEAVFRTEHLSEGQA